MADGDTTTTTTAATTTAATTTAAVAPWYEGKLDADLIGHAQNKGWKLDEPATVAIEAIKAHREVQKLIGVPAEKMLRIPEPSAPEAEIKAYWSRIGVPPEAKDYDFAGIKFSDGTEPDEKLTTALRGALLSARVTKDNAPAVVRAVIGHLDEANQSAAVQRQATLKEQNSALEQNWGGNFEANMFVARNAFLKTAAAAGMKEDVARAEAEKIFKRGNVLNATTMEMWRVIGSKMGEDRYVSSSGPGGDNMPMTREAAIAEINSLKGDPVFSKRYIEGGAEERKRMQALHKIAYAPAQAA